MEFLYRAGEQPHLPVSAGGFMEVHDIIEREAVRREMRKERIRQEIVAMEMEERRILEEEVRRELDCERMTGVRRLRDERIGWVPKVDEWFGGGSGLSGASLPTRDGRTVFVKEAPLTSLPYHDAGQRIGKLPHGDSEMRVHGLPYPEAGQRARELTPVVEVEDKKLPMSGTKRKASPILFNSKLPRPRQEWGCAICKVSCATKKSFDEHIKGKKHKSKAALELSTKLAKSNGIFKREWKQTEISKFEGKRCPPDLWCKICNLQCNSLYMMNEHCQGKKHKANLMEC